MTCAPSEDSDQPGHPPEHSLLHEETLGPKLSIECTAKTLIRLGRCPGSSESSMGAHVILLVLSCAGSFRDNTLDHSAKSATYTSAE